MCLHCNFICESMSFICNIVEMLYDQRREALEGAFSRFHHAAPRPRDRPKVEDICEHGGGEVLVDTRPNAGRDRRGHSRTWNPENSVDADGGEVVSQLSG